MELVKEQLHIILRTPTFRLSGTMTRGLVFVIALVICLSCFNQSALAWQIVSHADIPDGASMLAGGNGELWCSYPGEGDSLIRVLNPDNGEVEREITAPEAVCNGLAFSDQLFWFLGNGTLYRLNGDGEVVGQGNAPYENMRGLAATDNGFWTVANLGGRAYLALFDSDGNELARFRYDVEEPADITWDGAYLWLSNPADDLIHQIDPALERDVDVFPTPVETPTGIAWLDDALYLIDAGVDDNADLLFLIDPTAEGGPRILPGARYHFFGWVTIGGTAQWYLTIYNVGDQNLHLGGVSLTGENSGFSLGNFPPNGITISPGQFSQILVSFSPRYYEKFSDVIRISSNDSLEAVSEVTVAAVGVYSFGLLGVYPPEVDCGAVRADPWRDGSSLTRVYLYNQGREPIRIDSLLQGIEEIFQLDRPELPHQLTTTDTLTLGFWFTPHRGIRYLDTLVVIVSNSPEIATYIPLFGQGSDSVYAAGTVLWSHQLENGDHSYGAARPWGDISGDDIREVLSVGPTGAVYCLSGFASGDGDVVWRNDFEDAGFRPDQVLPNNALLIGGDLDGDGVGEGIIGAGGDDPSVYAINSSDGSLNWRWSAHQEGLAGETTLLSGSQDINGDGTLDPVLMLTDADAGESHIVRLDGVAGETIWGRTIGLVTGFYETTDLDRNGIREFATVSEDNSLLIVNGTTGRRMREINFDLLGGLAWVDATTDIDRDGYDDLLISYSDGGLVGYSLHDQSELWWVDVGFQEPGRLYGQMRTHTQSGSFIAVATARGWLLLINSAADGDLVWSCEVEGEPVSLAFIQDLDGDRSEELIVGYASGLVECRSSDHGALLWETEGEQEGFGSILYLDRFDDVDLGGTQDILALCGDGAVRCLSSYGDVTGIPDNGIRRGGLPESPSVSLYPNPFNGTTVLTFQSSDAGRVMLSLTDATGRQLQRFDFGVLPAGIHHQPVHLGAMRYLPNGIYLFQVESPGIHATGRGVLLK
jgi:outer membrane protein assembly factor BamB